MFAPWIAPFDFNQRGIGADKFPKMAPPSGEHWFGTSDQFFDVFSRVVYGARTALTVVALSVLFSVVIGVLLGLLSGYLGGWPDRVMVFVMDALYAFPSLLLAIVFSFLLSGPLGGGVVAAALSLTTIYIPQYFRVVRNTTVSAREATYIEAARALGAKDSTIMGRYLFGNVIQSVPVIGTLNAADAIGTLAALGFLGLGIQPNEAAEWGYDLSRALDDASAGIWWTSFFPGMAIVVLVVGAHPGRRGPQRDRQPVAAQAPHPQGRAAPARGEHDADRRRRAMTELVDGPARPEVGGDAVIDARDVRIWYGTERGPVKAVDGVSFSLRKGEILGLVGESGCGKSTLGRGLLACCPTAPRWTASCASRARTCSRCPPGRCTPSGAAELGMIFQEPLTRLNPLMRISEHFEETLRAHERGISKAEIERRSLAVLRTMGIPPTRYRSYPHEFSGGMRQRLMIALAVVLRPAFVVADEPTTALDVLVEAQIIRILHDLRREYDTSLLLITHNLGIIAEACDRVAVMYAGKIVEIGDARQVFRDPQHPYTRELLRSTISLSTTGLNFIPGAPPDLVEPPPGCHFHPRCPDAMNVCASKAPVDREQPNGTRCGLLGHRPAARLRRPDRRGEGTADP